MGVTLILWVGRYTMGWPRCGHKPTHCPSSASLNHPPSTTNYPPALSHIAPLPSTSPSPKLARLLLFVPCSLPLLLLLPRRTKCICFIRPCKAKTALHWMYYMREYIIGTALLNLRCLYSAYGAVHNIYALHIQGSEQIDCSYKV